MSESKVNDVAIDPTGIKIKSMKNAQTTISGDEFNVDNSGSTSSGSSSSSGSSGGWSKCKIILQLFFFIMQLLIRHFICYSSVHQINSMFYEATTTIDI